MLQTIGQILFTIGNMLCMLFDGLLLITVRAHRKSQPYVYIFSMCIFGNLGKFVYLFIVDAWPISELIDPLNGYTNYRNFMGKQITLTATFSYFGPICLNWLMTVHRVTVVLFPFKTWIFSDKNLSVYIFGITVLIFISMIIPYYSSCSINFWAPTTSFIAECAPDRHPITVFQNKYCILLPVSAMFVNFSLILYMRLTSKKKGVASSLSQNVSESNKKREKTMIRQATLIASYLSIYEIGNLYIRVFPEQFQNWPVQHRNCFYYFRLFTISSLNFFVYFIETKSTRKLVLGAVGSKSKSKSSKSNPPIVVVTVTS